MKCPISLSSTQQAPGSKHIDAAKALVREAQAARLDQVSINLDAAERKLSLPAPTAVETNTGRVISH